MTQAKPYPFEFLLLKQQWLLAEQQHELALSEQAVQEARARLRHLQADASALDALQRGALLQRDPVHRQWALDYLCALRRRLVHTQSELEHGEQRCVEQRQACADAQVRLDTLQTQRRRALDQQAMQYRMRLQVQADQDWTARALALTLTPT